MWWIIFGFIFTVLVAYILHTLSTSYGSDYTDNTFSAFIDKSQNTGNDKVKNSGNKYQKRYVQPGRQILILYGTEYGFSEEVAKELYDRIEDLPGNDYRWQPRIVNARIYDQVSLTQEKILLVVISTAGDGVPPTDARNFVSWLQTRSLPDITHLRYSVLALGDSNYVHFCRAGKIVDECLAALGSKCLVPRKNVDMEDRESIESWCTSVLESLNLLEIEPKLDYLQITEMENNSTEPSRDKPFMATLKVKYNLTNCPEEGDKETIHCEFDVKGTGISWIAGDALGIYPENDPAVVDSILSAINRSGSELVDIPKWAYQHKTDDRLTLRAVLLRFYDLKVIKPELLVKFRQHSTEGDQNSIKLDELIKDGLFKTNDILQEYISQREVVDVLEEFKGVGSTMNTNDLLNNMRALLPRYYSVSSSVVIDPDTVCVTAAVVRYRTLGKNRIGVTTTFLKDRLAIGHTCPVFMSRNPDFRLPDDGSKAIIMIGPGTGIAPFRAFIQERVSSRSTGNNLLYFGCRRRSEDFLYQSELKNWVKNGHLILKTAFSRDQPHKIYVQDLIRQDADLIWDLIDGGGHIYICGDARNMAKDVHQALVGVISSKLSFSQEEAEKFLSSLETSSRYQKDVWVA